MQLPKGATVAVADGEKLKMFRNNGDEAHPKLAALPAQDVESEHKGQEPGIKAVPGILRTAKFKKIVLPLALAVC